MNIIGSESGFNPRPLQADTGSRAFGMRYPSPFFDVAQQFLPTNTHQLHVWCRYYFLTNPIIHAACTKMAEYPVTNLMYDTTDVEVLRLYKELERRLKLREFQVEVGLDHFVYGNAFVSLYFPMVKYLVCASCGHRHEASKSRSRYKWRNMRFYLRCRECSHEGEAKETDVYIRSVRNIRLVRWNPENIDIRYNEITGKSRYYFKLPRHIVNDVKTGEPDTIETLPVDFLDAARTGKALLFNEQNLYHLKRPTLAQKDQGWGTPLIYPLLKDAYYLQILKKANEMVMQEHIVPMRMIFPGPNTGGNEGPYGSYNLSNWKRRVDEEIQLWKRDPNYIPILPVNVGYQQLGGQGRALLMHQEMRLIADQMLAGVGVPPEFIFGGISYSASNTSMRALENMFLGYNRQRHELINDFVLKGIAAFMGWPQVQAKFDKFKMADDLQRSMFYLQLNQATKLSDRRLMEELGEDFDTEIDRMNEELGRQLQVNRRTQVATADIQGEASLRSSRYQAKAQVLGMKAQAQAQMDMQTEQMQQQQQQQAPQQAAEVPGVREGATVYAENAGSPNEQALPVAMSGGVQSYLQPGSGGVDLRYVAQRAVSYLRTLREQGGEQQMNEAINQMKVENPPLHQLVVQLLNDTGSKLSPTDGLKNPAPEGTPQASPGRQTG